MLEGKSADPHSHQVSSSGDYAYLDRLSWQCIQWLLRCFSLDQSGGHVTQATLIRGLATFPSFARRHSQEQLYVAHVTCIYVCVRREWEFVSDRWTAPRRWVRANYCSLHPPSQCCTSWCLTDIELHPQTWQRTWHLFLSAVVKDVPPNVPLNAHWRSTGTYFFRYSTDGSWTALWVTKAAIF